VATVWDKHSQSCCDKRQALLSLGILIERVVGVPLIVIFQVKYKLLCDQCSRYDFSVLVKFNDKA